MKYKKNQGDFMKHLKTQLRFMELSSKSYDEGFEDEAQRLAATIRVLFHDTSSSTSLLTHLGMKNNIYLISSTSQYVPANLISYLGLLTMKMTVGVGGEYEPNCNSHDDMPNKWLKFNDWWNEIVIDDKNNVFSRRDLILDVSNKDGGSHVDHTLNDKYSNLTINNSIGWMYSSENTESAFDNNPAYACIRQIAHEIMFSFRWMEMIKTYTRVGSSKTIKASYVGTSLYLYEEVSDTAVSKLFDDPKVTRLENRKFYHDTVILKDNSRQIRGVISD
jgi:hypothetical protein